MDWGRECEDIMKNGNQFCFDSVYCLFSPRFYVCDDFQNHCQMKMGCEIYKLIEICAKFEHYSGKSHSKKCIYENLSLKRGNIF